MSFDALREEELQLLDRHVPRQVGDEQPHRVDRTVLGPLLRRRPQVVGLLSDEVDEESVGRLGQLRLGLLAARLGVELQEGELDLLLDLLDGLPRHPDVKDRRAEGPDVIFGYRLFFDILD